MAGIDITSPLNFSPMEKNYKIWAKNTHFGGKSSILAENCSFVGKLQSLAPPLLL